MLRRLALHAVNTLDGTLLRCARIASLRGLLARGVEGRSRVLAVQVREGAAVEVVGRVRPTLLGSLGRAGFLTTRGAARALQQLRLPPLAPLLEVDVDGVRGDRRRVDHRIEREVAVHDLLVALRRLGLAADVVLAATRPIQFEKPIARAGRPVLPLQ